MPGTTRHASDPSTSRTCATSSPDTTTPFAPAVTASNGHDQVRILTPEEAIERGADYLVVGRPITGSSDPAGVARAIRATVR